MGGFHVARGTTTTKQTAKRWAAMRLLHQLKHGISPAFYNDTPEGWSALLHLMTLMTAGDFCCTYCTSVTYTFRVCSMNDHAAERRMSEIMTSVSCADEVVSPLCMSRVILAANSCM